MTTKAAEILELGEVTFVEPTFSDLTDITYNVRLLETEGDQGRLLLDEENEPIALAFHETGWVAGSFLYRRPTASLIEQFESTNGEIYQEEREVWAAAIRDYYSRKIMADVTPSVEDLNPGRVSIIERLLWSQWGGRTNETCLDCCCGSGVGSVAIRKIGLLPLSYDNDPALLSLGLRKGRLLPAETMWIDATRATRYTPPVHFGVGIMLGEINSFNEEMWEAVVHTLVVLTRETLITVGTEAEARQVEQWADERQQETQVFENDTDPIYDRWVIMAKGGEPGKLG